MCNIKKIILNKSTKSKQQIVAGMHDIGLLSVMKVKQNKIFKLFCLTYNINFYIKGLLYSKKIMYVNFIPNY